jgi:phage-related protein (TIGR01555 family)
MANASNGGMARAKSLSKQARSAIASKAASARWAKNDSAAVKDMYANQAANIGFGTSSAVNAGRHIPFRLSLDYQKLVFMYRGSWVIRAVVDTKPQDQNKGFPTLLTQVTPEDISDFNKVIAETCTLQKFIEGRKWGRLFGGALGVIIIDGDNDLSKPLILENVQPDSYKGMIVVDRWSGMSPSSDLITDRNRPSEYGLPVSYQIYTEASESLKVHHSRCLRFVGRDLPLFERQIEQYWGMSEIECILDELQRYDFGMAGVADLISRANVMVFQNDMLNQMLSGLNLTQQQMADYAARMQAVSETISTNGLLALGENEQLFTHQYAFGGLSDVMKMQMTALCGAAGYPFSRLFGDTQTGLGQSNEGDLQNYYDTCDQERRQKDRPLFDKLIPIICMSTWGEVPDDLDYAFAPIRTMNSKEKADLAKVQSESITGYYNAGLLGRKTSLREIKTTSQETGLGTNVTDEMIESADDEVQVPLEIEQEEARAGTEEFGEGKNGVEVEKKMPDKGGTKDSWWKRGK